MRENCQAKWRRERIKSEREREKSAEKAATDESIDCSQYSHKLLINYLVLKFLAPF